MRTAFQSVSTHGEQNMPKLIKHIKCRWTPTLRQNDITLLAPRCLLSRCCWCLSLHTRAAAQNSKKNKDTYVSHVRVELLKYIAGIHIDSKEYLVYSTSWYLFTGTSSTVHVSPFFSSFLSSLLLSTSTRRRFYPQRSSGQAVVTGVVPSPPGTCLQFLSRIGFSIPTARRFSSNVANSRSRAFR